MAFIVAAIPDLQTRDRIQELLTAAGHIPVLFSCVVPAATEVLDGLPDAVVLDIRLPEPGVLHVLTAMHGQASAASIPVLVYGPVAGPQADTLAEAGVALIRVGDEPPLLPPAVQAAVNARHDGRQPATGAAM